LVLSAFIRVHLRLIKTPENSRSKPPPQYMLMPTGEQDFFDLTETALWICT
jgi:hypothetical protein